MTFLKFFNKKEIRFMAKTTQLTGHAAFAALFPRFSRSSRHFIRPFLGRLSAQTEKRFFHSEQIAHSPKAELSIRIVSAWQKRAATSIRADFTPSKNDFFTQNKSPPWQKTALLIKSPHARQKHILLQSLQKRQHFSYGKVEFFTAVQT